MRVRAAAVAGSWYPGTAAVLSRAVERHLEEAATSAPSVGPARPVALVAPHAGLRYSGTVAAHAYRYLRDSSYEFIILVGPSHYVAFDGVSVIPEGECATPLGPLPVEASVASDLLRAGSVCRDYPEAHRREHSLELQFPFLAMLAPQTPIVPLVMGEQSRATVDALGEAIAAAAKARRTLLVASSDLSHFNPRDVAARMDHGVIDRINAFDTDGLMALLEREPDRACGGGPIVAVLRAARSLGASAARVLHYADSGDVSGDTSSVVGYLAALAT